MLHQAKPLSTSPPPEEKLIFAPGAAPSTTHGPGPGPSQAAQFSAGTLHRRDLTADPFTQFHAWFSHPSLQSHVPETCTLSTAALPSGRISSRMVYLKELDRRGFVVYSNFGTSRKAADLASNPWASLVFWWKPLERQVRVEGRAERLTERESQAYFDTRARGSRIGAWASQQSTVLRPADATQAAVSDTAVEGGARADAGEDDGRSMLEEQVRAVGDRFTGQDHIPVPPFWGGLRIVPESVEFWQGRESRLHDRFMYTRLAKSGAGEGEEEEEEAAEQSVGNGEWRIERLSP